MVNKPDGTVRFVVDYRKVNAISHIDAYPLPRIDDMIDRIGNAKYITKFDISKAYWQVPLDKESKEISAFTTPFGLFQFKVLPFGLASAASTFQRLMSKVLRGLERFCLTYLDDITIYSNTWEEHIKHIEEVLERISRANLTIKKSKCEFANAEVHYLGHVVGNGKVKPNQMKIASILNFPPPSDKKQLRQFLGVLSFYRRFIPHMAHISSVLTDLLKKNQTFVWSEQAHTAFLSVKSILSSAPILRPPDLDKPFSIACDASDKAIGAVLLQIHDGILHPVSYLSQKLNVHQQRYSVIEKECLALVTAVRTFAIYFDEKEVLIQTDHNPLRFLNTMANQNKKIWRWNMELQQYNLNIQYKPGKHNTIPDILSRPSDT